MIGIIFRHFLFYTMSTGYFLTYLICLDFRIPGNEPFYNRFKQNIAKQNLLNQTVRQLMKQQQLKRQQ